MRGAKTVTGDIQGPGIGRIDNQSCTGHAARAGRTVGCVARVTEEVKAANEESTLKAGGTVRAGAAVATKCASPECGHPSKHAARVRDALRKIGPADYRVPVPTVTSRTETLGTLHIRCPPKTKCPNS